MQSTWISRWIIGITLVFCSTSVYCFTDKKAKTFVDKDKFFQFKAPPFLKCQADAKERMLCTGRYLGTSYKFGVFSQTIEQSKDVDVQMLLRAIALNEHEKYAKKPHINFIRVNGLESLPKNEYFEYLEVGGQRGIAQSFVYDSLAQTTLRKHVIRARVFHKNRLFSLSLKTEQSSYEKNARFFKELLPKFSFDIEKIVEKPSDLKVLMSELNI